MTRTDNNSTNETSNRTNPRTKENTMSIRTLITAAGTFALSVACLVSPAKAESPFGQGTHVTAHATGRNRVHTGGSGQPVFRAVYSASAIFPQFAKWARNERQIIAARDHYRGKVHAYERILKRCRFGSREQIHYSRLWRDYSAKMNRMNNMLRDVRWYNSIKHITTTVHLVGPRANSDRMRQIVAQLQARTRTWGRTVYENR